MACAFGFGLDLLGLAFELVVVAQQVSAVFHELVRVYGLVVAFHAEEGLSGLVFRFFCLQVVAIPIEKERLVEPIISLLGVRPLLLTILFLRSLLVLLVRLRLGMLMRRLRILRDGFIMQLRSILLILLIADDLVLVAEDLLLGLQQLQIGRGGLRDLVVIFDLEFVGHYLNYIASYATW